MLSRECALSSVSGSSKVISRSTGRDVCISRRGNARGRRCARNLHSISISYADIGSRAFADVYFRTASSQWYHRLNAFSAPGRFGDLNGWQKKGNGFHFLAYTALHETPLWFSTMPIYLVSHSEKKRRITSSRTDICVQSRSREKLIEYGCMRATAINVNWSIFNLDCFL